jgi:hypothetical protein
MNYVPADRLGEVWYRRVLECERKEIRVGERSNSLTCRKNNKQI